MPFVLRVSWCSARRASGSATSRSTLESTFERWSAHRRVRTNTVPALAHHRGLLAACLQTSALAVLRVAGGQALVADHVGSKAARNGASWRRVLPGALHIAVVQIALGLTVLRSLASRRSHIRRHLSGQSIRLLDIHRKAHDGLGGSGDSHTAGQWGHGDPGIISL